MAVNYGLGYLASGIPHNVDVSLAMIQNGSKTVARINTLPPELLARIFALLMPLCVRGKRGEARIQDITAVCVYWRQVATSATSLWTHIDVSPNIPDSLINLSLERTTNMPIHIHFHQPDYRNPDTKELELTTEVIDAIATHMHRVSAFDLEVDDYRLLEKTIRALSLWLCGGSPSLSNALSIQHYDVQVIDETWDDELGLTRSNSSEHAEAMLRSISTLQLQNLYFHWNSSVYHGLVDLRLLFHPCRGSMSASQLVDVLSRSPELAILKLENLNIYKTEGWVQPTPILLKYLTVLNLAYMEPDSRELLWTLIDLSNSLPEISLGVQIDDQRSSELEGFLVRSKITTLCCRDDGWFSQPPQLPSRRCLSHIHTLILDEIVIIDALSEIANPQPPQLSSSRPVFGVILVRCEVALDGLRDLVSEYDIRELRLDECQAISQGEANPDLMHDIQKSLLEMFPWLQLSISN
ncbi:hypothetical protein FRC07_003884, partial [Ceratobasidium sp. 392]